MAMLSTLSSSSRSVRTLLLLLLLLLMSGGRAQKCGVGKGDVALTEALHEEHLADPDAGLLGNVTCVPDFAFRDYRKHVDLTPCKLLVSIGKSAFMQTTGGVTMGGGEGAYPLLKEIGLLAFEAQGIQSHQMVKESSIELIHLPALESIGGNAFKYFKGKFVMRGRFPALTTFPDTAYKWIVGTDDSKMNVQCTKGNSFDIPSSKPNTFKGTWTQALYGQLPTCTTCSEEAGHVPLTKANFRSADVKNEVTCIPDHEFSGYSSQDVNLLQRMHKLEFIGASAFQGFQKKLVINGDLPALRFIGGSAFHSASSADSYVQFHTAPKLETIGDQAFNQFKGQIHITGALPNLKTIGALAFHTASNANSIITLSNLPKIESLTLQPFQNFGGTLTIEGAFPSLAVQNNAGWSSSYIAYVTPSSLIEILCLRDFPSGGFVSQGLGSFPGTWNTANTVICNGCILEANAVVLTRTTPPADYGKVTCIAAKSFQNCAASNGAAIHLKGMEALQYIEDEAFSGCSQMDLSMTGPFPSLLTIGRGTFKKAGSSAYSHITLGDAPLLTDIGDYAFDGFLGKLSVEGKAPALARIGESAFANRASEESSVVMNGADYAALKEIEDLAFGDCDGNVTMTGDFPALERLADEAFSLFHGVLTIDASFPNLNYLGPSAFMEVESKLSSVKLGSNSLTYVHRSTFNNFKGLLTLGEDFFGDIGANGGLKTIGISAFEGVTHPESRIDMLGVPSLTHIGHRAFYNFGGKLTLKGAPKLVSKGNFGPNVFGDGVGASKTAVITLDSMSKLESISGSAFQFLGFKGTLKIVGDFSALTTLDSFSANVANTEMTLIIHASVCGLTAIESVAFDDVRTAASNVHLYCLDSLEEIGGYAFYNYRGSLRLEGAAPNLHTIDQGAFGMKEHDDRTISVRLCEVDQAVVENLLSNTIWTTATFLSGGTPLPLTTEACPATTTTATTRTTTTTTFAAATLPTCAGSATPPPPLTSTFDTSAADCGLGIPSGSHEIMTLAMLLKGSTAFKGVRCIPPGLFKSQNIDPKTGVTFNDFDALEVIGDGAFEEATGSFKVAGSFPALRAIGDRAFKDARAHEESEAPQVMLHDPTNLVHVGDHAFDSFQGAVELHSSSAASLASIGNHAFGSIPSNTSKIALWGIWDLAKIGKRAFAGFAGEVKIIGRARYLTDVSPETFQGLSATNQIALSSIPSASVAMLTQEGYDVMPQRITSNDIPCGQVDGDVKLTGKRIEESDFNDVTCIPTAMGTDLVDFKNYAIRSVAMRGACFPKLVWIDVKAFENSKARNLLLTMDGDFAALRYIGDEAFNLAGRADSRISLVNLRNLRELGYEAFGDFEGSVLLEGGPKLHTIGGFAFFRASVQMRGDFPKLHTIGINAFGLCKPDCNVVLNDLESLTHIDEEAFDGMKGHLEVTGNFPSLQTVGADAFKGIASKKIDISCLGVDHDQAACTGATTGCSGVTVACGTVCSSATPFSSTATPTTSTTVATTTTTPPVCSDGILMSTARHGRCCPDDGTAGLTRAVYEAGNKTVWAAVTCVPKYEFSDYQNDVTLDGQDFGSLQRIEEGAFSSVRSKLTITGTWEKLEAIGFQAFWGHSSGDSKVEFAALPALVSVRENIFGTYTMPESDFKGSVSFPETIEKLDIPCQRLVGTDVVVRQPDQIPLTRELYEESARGGGGNTQLPAVTCIPDYEFTRYDKNVTVRGVDFDSLATVGSGAFSSMSGKLLFTGPFPSLRKISMFAFSVNRYVDVRDVGSRIEIACSSPAGLTIGDGSNDVFEGFKGVHVDDNEQTRCNNLVSTTTATSTRTTTATSATATSTTSVVAKIVGQGGPDAGADADQLSGKFNVGGASEQTNAGGGEVDGEEGGGGEASEDPEGEGPASSAGVIVGVTLVAVISAIIAVVVCMRKKEQHRQRSFTHSHVQNNPVYNRRGSADNNAADVVYLESDPNQPALYDGVDAGIAGQGGAAASSMYVEPHSDQPARYDLAKMTASTAAVAGAEYAEVADAAVLGAGGYVEDHFVNKQSNPQYTYADLNGGDGDADPAYASTA